LARSKETETGRRQVVSRRTHRRPARSGGGSLSSALRSVIQFVVRFARPLAFIFAIVLCLVAYHLAAGSRAFELHRVEVKGASDSLSAEVEQAARRAVGGTRLLDVNLPGVKQKVESISRVSSAWVSRVLPDVIRIEVTERRPVVLVRREKTGAMVWLDEDAVELGDISSVRSDDAADIPAIATGFSEGARSAAAVEEDKERVKIYLEMKNEFTSEPNPIWKLVDQIDLAFTKDVSVHLVKTLTTIHLASHDFRNRMDTALTILDAVRRGDKELLGRFRVQDPDKLIKNVDHIAYVDAARPDRIVLQFSSAASEKAGKSDKPGKGEGKKSSPKPVDGAKAPPPGTKASTKVAPAGKQDAQAKKPSRPADSSNTQDAQHKKKARKKPLPGSEKLIKQDGQSGKAPGKSK
jgi:hypothetical protein